MKKNVFQCQETKKVERKKKKITVRPDAWNQLKQTKKKRMQTYLYLRTEGLHLAGHCECITGMEKKPNPVICS